MTTTNTSNPQSANKWAPTENDIESQIMQLALITQSDLNFLAQMFNLLSYSEQGRKRYHDFLLRENKKRWYFSTQVPTHELKAFVENFKAELDEFDKENLSPEDQEKRLKEMQELKDKLSNLFVEMNTQLKSLNLDPVDTLENMVKTNELRTMKMTQDLDDLTYNSIKELNKDRMKMLSETELKLCLDVCGLIQEQSKIPYYTKMIEERLSHLYRNKINNNNDKKE